MSAIAGKSALQRWTVRGVWNVRYRFATSGHTIPPATLPYYLSRTLSALPTSLSRQPASPSILHASSLLPLSVRCLATQSNSNAEKSSRKDVIRASDEDPFDALTDRIPVKPVTAVEASSYGVVIFGGLALAALAMYAVVKELLIGSPEYKVFNKALKRVQEDSRIMMRIGKPIVGYGQESRNRATRQRVQFHIRGPHGAGIVHCEMFKDKEDWDRLKFTYLIVDVTAPSATRIMLESYMPDQPKLA